MAGIEVAGLVMAFNPLLVSTLDSLKSLREYRNAPAAVAEINSQVAGLAAVLDALKKSKVEAAAIQTELARAEAVLADLSNLLRYYRLADSERPMAALKIRWTLQRRQMVDTLLQDLGALSTRLGMLLNLETMKSLREAALQAPEIVIAVMGVTGSGKSRLIRQILGRDEVTVGHSLKSETQSVQAYSLTIDGRTVTFVDTPGFDDTYRSDVEIFEETAKWLSTTYESGRMLSGLIYTHRITDVRMSGQALQSLDVFAKLVGADSYFKILLVTTMWDILPDIAEGHAREEELREGFWKPLIDKGSLTARSSGDKSSASVIMKRVVFNQRLRLASHAPLTIQKDEHRREVVSKSYDEAQRQKQERPYATVHLSTSVLLANDPPPPYTPRKRSTTREALDSAVSLLVFSLSPFILMYATAAQVARKWTRSKLQQGYSRVEWTCSCGDVLHGDYMERSPGSLQSLATQLNGRIISSAAAQGSAAGPANASIQSPAQAHVRSTSAAPVSGGAGSAAPAPNQMPGAQGAQGGPRIAVQAQHNPPAFHNRWLELCIRSGQDTYSLGEIDMAGQQSDRTVFQQMREKYRAVRRDTGLFGRFALRAPSGCVFVQFRKDKLASLRNPVATASVMVKPSVPSPAEAASHHYVFDPVPMDEPPMASNNFNHYFQKPHDAENYGKWIKRFPQLQDPSLFYSNENLKKGWGIEIVESRNWMVFVCANVIALLVSGGVATLFSIYMKDKQTGVALGAWLTAVQTLVANALLWRWTNQ